MQVTLHTPETIYAPRHLPSWFLLAAAASKQNPRGALGLLQKSIEEAVMPFVRKQLARR